MKTKIYIHLILITLLALPAWSAHAQTLSEMSARFNKTCPIDQGVVSINKTTFSGNIFSLYIAYADGQISFDSLRLKPSAGEAFAAFYVGIMYRSSPYMVTRMLSKNVPFRLMVSEKFGDERYSASLPPSKIKEAIKKYGNLSADMMMLEKDVVYGEITKDILKVVLHPDGLEYQYTFDDSYYNDDYLETSKEEIRKSIKANLMTQRDMSNAATLTALKHTHRNLKYTYIGTTGKTVSVILDQDDLNDLMNK
jgi:hypothetical protein